MEQIAQCNPRLSALVLLEGVFFPRVSFKENVSVVMVRVPKAVFRCRFLGKA